MHESSLSDSQGKASKFCKYSPDIATNLARNNP